MIHSVCFPESGEDEAPAPKYSSSWLETDRYMYERDLGQTFFMTVCQPFLERLSPRPRVRPSPTPPQLGEFSGVTGLLKAVLVANSKLKLAGMDILTSSVANTAITTWDKREASRASNLCVTHGSPPLGPHACVPAPRRRTRSSFTRDTLVNSRIRAPPLTGHFALAETGLPFEFSERCAVRTRTQRAVGHPHPQRQRARVTLTSRWRLYAWQA